jgi:hypothetical protein
MLHEIDANAPVLPLAELPVDELLDHPLADCCFPQQQELHLQRRLHLQGPLFLQLLPVHLPQRNLLLVTTIVKPQLWEELTTAHASIKLSERDNSPYKGM